MRFPPTSRPEVAAGRVEPDFGSEARRILRDEADGQMHGSARSEDQAATAASAELVVGLTARARRWDTNSAKIACPRVRCADLKSSQASTRKKAR